MQKICSLIIILIGIFITNITFAGGSHMFTFKSIDGKDTINLSDFSGKAVLVVNTASRCGFTSQYDGLQTIWEEYKDRGIHFNSLALGSVQTKMLEKAFPNFTASTSALEMAEYIYNFSTQGYKLMNGKVISVSSTTP